MRDWFFIHLQSFKILYYTRVYPLIFSYGFLQPRDSSFSFHCCLSCRRSSHRSLCCTSCEDFYGFYPCREEPLTSGRYRDCFCDLVRLWDDYCNGCWDAQSWVSRSDHRSFWYSTVPHTYWCLLCEEALFTPSSHDRWLLSRTVWEICRDYLLTHYRTFVFWVGCSSIYSTWNHIPDGDMRSDSADVWYVYRRARCPHLYLSRRYDLGSDHGFHRDVSDLCRSDCDFLVSSG